MAPESSITVTVNSRKAVSGKKIIRTISMLVILLVIAFPFLWLIISSFKHEKDIISFPPRIFADSYTLDNYIKVWTTIPLLDYIKNTVIFAGGTVITSVFFDSLAGYAFARMRFKGKSVLFYFVLLTMMIPFQVFMIPLFIEVNLLGMLDTYAGLIIPRMTTAFGIFMMRSFFITLPDSLEEAARIDGLSEFNIFLKIMLPLSKPTLLSLGIFTLMNSWNDLLYPLILTSSSKMRTLPAGLALFTGQNISFYGPVMAQWKGEGSGNIIYFFFQGIKQHFGKNLFLSLLTIIIYFLVNQLLEEQTIVLSISGYVVLLIYSMFLLSWIYVISENKDITFLQIFEQSAWKVFFDFLRNILCCVLLLGFVLLIFLFPPFIFIFAGGVWKLVSIILTIGNER